jgi:hypothetical protein
MARKNRRSKRRFSQQLGRSDVFYSEYRPFTIIPPESKPKRGTVPFITAGALIAVGAALFFVFAG